MLINSGNVDKAASGFLEAAAVAMFALISMARPGFFKTFFAIFFDTLSPFSSEFLIKLPRPSACIVSSLTVIDFFPLQIELCATNKLISPPVLFIECYDFCTRLVFLTNAITNSFNFLKAHLIVQILIDCNVNVSPFKKISL